MHVSYASMHVLLEAFLKRTENCISYLREVEKHLPLQLTKQTTIDAIES